MRFGGITAPETRTRGGLRIASTCPHFSKGYNPQLIDRYARRMVIENAIADAIDFFHMDALSAAVPMKVGLDLQLTLIAGGLYRLLAIRLGTG